MPEQTIILIRHAAPEVSTSERIRGSEFADWLARYDASPIVPPSTPLPQYDKVYCSTLLRARQTAALLSANIVSDARLVEAPVPPLSFGGWRLKATHFVLVARLLWMLGIHRQVESSAKAKARAATAAAWLEQTAEREGQVVVVAHGFINHLIGKALRRRGWQRKSDATSSQHLGQTRFVLHRH